MTTDAPAISIRDIRVIRGCSFATELRGQMRSQTGVWERG